MTPSTAIAFSVVDTGVGVPKHKQEEIFDAFKQADGSTSREFGGKGLGLTISRQFAQLMGGELRLESVEGKGTTFTLFVNLDPKSNMIAQNNFVPEIIHTNPSATVVEHPAVDAPIIQWFEDDRDKITTDAKVLLIIEDDEQFAKILLQEGRAHDYLCIAAEHGVNGIALAIKYQPSAILLDLGLPDMSGEQVLSELKSHSVTNPIPVHILSAADKDSSLIESGAIGFLQKPASKDDLTQLFKRFEGVMQKGIKRVLVIEDDVASQAAIQKLISHEGAEIIKAEIGRAHV